MHPPAAVSGRAVPRTDPARLSGPSHRSAQWRSRSGSAPDGRHDRSGGDAGFLTQALLDDVIPVVCRARALELVWYQAGNCHLLERWQMESKQLH